MRVAMDRMMNPASSGFVEREAMFMWVLYIENDWLNIVVTFCIKYYGIDFVKDISYYGGMFNRFRKYFSRRIYLDYASLTPIDPRVVKEVVKYSNIEYANPSSWYSEGVTAKDALARARAIVAGFIHAHPDEIIFTSGGTEANNLALKGVVRASRANGVDNPHIIISAIEHSSIMESANELERQGCEITRIPVDHRGVVVLDELRKAIKENTVLITVMTVNNETGVIQPIREIAKIVRDVRKGHKFSNPQSAILSSSNLSIRQYPIFHTDAAQALYTELFVEKMGVDLLTLDAGKMYGPRGVGCLYMKRDTLILPIIFGGGQEAGMRSGTENIPGIMGFAKAVRIAEKERSKEAKKQIFLQLKSTMIVGLKKIRSDIFVNGEEAECSPHILNVSIPGIDNEFFVFQLDAKGIACSTKSSCLLAQGGSRKGSQDEDESYVLQAMKADSRSSIRFSFGRWTKKGDIRKALKAIGEILND
jgi:cysteine desulfurase